MSDVFNFLPRLPLAINQPILVGLLLLAGLLGGEIAHRLLALPKIVGYVAIGMLLGPLGLGWLGADLQSTAHILLDLALGLILFELGRRVDLRWLRNDPWLLVASLTESACGFALVYIVLRQFGIQPLFAAVAAAIGIGTSPATVMLVAHELKAEGQITSRALLLTALNSVTAFVVLTILLPLLHVELHSSTLSTLLHPLYLLVGSGALGWLAANATIMLAHWIGKREDRQSILLFGAIFVTVGCAQLLNLSVLIALLGFGVMARNLDYERDLMNIEFGHGGLLMFVLLFVLTGAGLDVPVLQSVWLMAFAYIGARFAGKALGILPFSMLSGMPWHRTVWLAVALTPMSALAVAMVHDAARIFPEFGGRVAVVVLTAAAILELLGPIATQFALKRTNEAKPD